MKVDFESETTLNFSTQMLQFFLSETLFSFKAMTCTDFIFHPVK
jgi:hypothetical protein